MAPQKLCRAAAQGVSPRRTKTAIRAAGAVKWREHPGVEAVDEVAAFIFELLAIGAAAELVGAPGEPLAGERFGVELGMALEIGEAADHAGVGVVAVELAKAVARLLRERSRRVARDRVDDAVVPGHEAVRVEVGAAHRGRAFDGKAVARERVSHDLGDEAAGAGCA